MKVFISAVLFSVFLSGCTYEPTPYEIEINNYWNELNTEFRDPHQSPLKPEDRKNFTELERFPTDEDFRVTATFVADSGKEKLVMATSDYDRKYYRMAGKLKFVLHGDTFSLGAYRNAGVPAMPAAANKFFVPFTDKTNGKDTYMGGRYLDLEFLPDTTTSVVVDFNKAYNPYCVYNENFSCPIPPLENHLNTEIKAGAKLPQGH